jgi:hypothetical protein
MQMEVHQLVKEQEHQVDQVEVDLLHSHRQDQLVVVQETHLL